MWTFQLRKGVKFHDGTPFNADAVVFDLDRQLNKENPYYLEGKFPYAKFTFGMIAKYEALDDYTVRITLKNKFAPFLKNLAMFAAAIPSPEAVKKYGADIFKHPEGTGPFKFVEWVPDDTITIAANEDYWGGRPLLDKVVFKVIPDNAVRLMKLEKGELDAIDGINPNDLNRIRSNKDLVLLEQPGMNVGYLAMHCQKPPFTDKRVRQALNYAVNKEEICKYLMNDQAVPATGVIPPSLWGYDPDQKGYPYDPKKARQLLAEAGFPNGFKTTLRAYTAPRGYNPVGDRLATAIQSYFKEVGVDAKIETLEWGTYLAEGRAGKHEMALFGWMGDNGDPDNFLYVLLGSDNFGSGNRAFYKNDEVDRLLKEAQQTYDEKKRLDLYIKAQRIIVDDAPWVFLNHTKQLAAIRKEVKGFKLHPTSNRFFHGVSIDK